MKQRYLTLVFATLTALPVMAEDAPYAGLQTRDISSLSDTDIAALEQGAGWGLALPAELNGYPGPAHVLEHADALALSAEQKAEVTAIFEAMRDEAQATGAVLIAAEAALDAGFRDGGLTDPALRDLIVAAEKARADLRFVHLRRHLETKALLSPHQVAEYDRLRGYTDDPCAAVPEGHNAEMWRKHNGCDG